MGFFSWKTCDTGRSISNTYSDRDTFTVHMITPDGRVFTESSYDGYGEFGGRDFYALLFELNGGKLTGNSNLDRSAGLEIAFKNNHSGDDTEGVIYPKFVEYLETDVAKLYSELPNPEGCEYQGYFYEDENEDYDYEDEYDEDEDEYDEGEDEDEDEYDEDED